MGPPLPTLPPPTGSLTQRSSCCVFDLGFATGLSESGAGGCPGVIGKGGGSLFLSLQAHRAPGERAPSWVSKTLLRPSEHFKTLPSRGCKWGTGAEELRAKEGERN